MARDLALNLKMTLLQTITLHEVFIPRAYNLMPFLRDRIDKIKKWATSKKLVRQACYKLIHSIAKSMGATIF